MPLSPSPNGAPATAPSTARLVLFNAPAGHGKTRTVVERYGDGGDPREPVRWIRCAPGSVDTVWADLSRAIAFVTGSSPDAEDPSPETVKRAATELAAPCTVVIDDYHHATSAANDLALADLIEAAPRLSLVVAGRRVHLLDGPLVTGRIAVHVLGPEDFAVSAGEAMRMAAEAGLPETERLRLAVEQTRGWPLAVRAALGPGADPIANLTRFALHHLELLDDPSRRIILIASQLDAAGLDQLAEAAECPIAEARACVHDLLERGLLLAAHRSEITEFRCHPAVQPALAARSLRSSSPARRAALLRDRASRIAAAAPFTAFTHLCAAGAYPEAEAVLAQHFTAITDEGEEAARLLRALPESALAAHSTFVAARLLLEGPDPAAPLPMLRRLLEQALPALRERILAEEAAPTEMHLPLLVQAMTFERFVGDADTAHRIAEDVEARLNDTAPDEAHPAARGAHGASVSRSAFPMHAREIALSALRAGDLPQARRNLRLLRAHAEQLMGGSALAGGSPALATVSDAESGRRWLLAALNELALTELLDGDLRSAAELLEQSESLGASGSGKAPGNSRLSGEIARAVLASEQGDERMFARAEERIAPMRDRVEQWPLVLLAEAEMVRRSRGADWALSQLDASVVQASESGRRLSGAWYEHLVCYRVMLHTVLGDVSAAAQRLADLPDARPDAQIERARIALFSGDPVGSLLLAQRIGDAGTTRRQQLDRCLVSAVAAWDCGRTDESLSALRNAGRLIRGGAPTSTLAGVPHSSLREIAEAASDAGGCELLDLIDSVPEPARPRRYERLTGMELRTLATIAEHRTYNRAAAALYVASSTVKKHLASVYRKLHAKNRDEAILVAKRMGLLDGEPPARESA
ncbi:hypothetical protein J4H92_07075 [Leucobacter weissii]|uniref:HTH luxR-type domain-containing protein n=1 Tax=Leucobacter weissii TaxID=1983706 RepID=A0A939MK50_9MICO|nr:LuxR C-terminal-related transcriptional regulator [Leucobacter weissii]MBO1901715.1 hypothetical protein [Leucobacter weissii]